MLMRLAALASLLPALASPAESTLPAELPEKVFLKTPTRAFSRRYDFALVDGRIWWKVRQPRLNGPAPAWALLGPEGLPFRREGKSAEDPKRILSISADASGLVAISDDYRIFDADIQEAETGKFFWNYGWGFPWRLLPDRVHLPNEHRAWSYSLLNMSAGWSEDIDGNPHTIIGVDSVYMLAPDGRSLWFNDPWLPPNKFDFRISVPERGAFAAVNLSASGSLVMVIDRRGRIYTRLVDFDTLGGNPGITYSWDRVNRGYEKVGFGAFMRGLLPMFLDVRSLPSESWRRQPDVTDGKLTRTITVLQTGEGNAARELRVEGTDQDGNTGYWFKAVHDERWEFAKSGHTITEPFLDPAAPPEATGSTDENLEGTATFSRRAQDPDHQLQIKLGPYGRSSSVSMPARLTGFNIGFDPITVNLPVGSGLALTLHVRPWSFPIRKGFPIRLLGALEVPAAVEKSTDEQLRKAVQTLLGGKRITPVFVHLENQEVRVEANAFGQGTDRTFLMRFAWPHAGATPPAAGGPPVSSQP